MAMVAYFYLKHGLFVDTEKNLTTPCRHDALEYLYSVIQTYKQNAEDRVESY